MNTPETRFPAFKGTVQKIRIDSNNVCFGPCPEPDDEVEQHLTLNSLGRVWYSSYTYGHGRHELSRSLYFTTNEKQAQQVLDAVGRLFSTYSPVIITDIGSWNLTITNTDGEKFKYTGPLCAYNDECVTISKRIRHLTGLEELYVFDGNMGISVQSDETGVNCAEQAADVILSYADKINAYDREYIQSEAKAGVEALKIACRNVFGLKISDVFLCAQQEAKDSLACRQSDSYFEYGSSPIEIVLDARDIYMGSMQLLRMQKEMQCDHITESEAYFAGAKYYLKALRRKFDPKGSIYPDATERAQEQLAPNTERDEYIYLILKNNMQSPLELALELHMTKANVEKIYAKAAHG